MYKGYTVLCSFLCSQPNDEAGRQGGQQKGVRFVFLFLPVVMNTFKAGPLPSTQVLVLAADIPPLKFMISCFSGLSGRKKHR